MTFAHVNPRWTLFCALLVHLHTAVLSLPTTEPEATNAFDKGNSCINGLWRNELGSKMLLQAVGSTLKGAYTTAVESSPGAAGPLAELTGFVSEGAQPTVTFSVLWKKGSCTSWVGQCLILPTGDRVLKTIWVLRSAAKSPADNWMSTRVGEDTFFRAGKDSEHAL